MFQASDLDNSTPRSAARTLTYQLLNTFDFRDAQLAEELLRRRNRSGKSQSKYFKSLWELFYGHVRKLTSAIIIIDALDECREMAIFAEHLLELSQATQLKILITIRREANLISYFSDHPYLHFGAEENCQDISLYLSAHISSIENLSNIGVSEWRFERLQMSLSEYLSQCANGLFIWAALVVKEPELQTTIGDVLRTENKIPPTLAGLYITILTRIPVSRRRLCTTILKWLICAVRPLAIGDMEEILRIETCRRDDELLVSEKEVTYACGSLIFVEKGEMHLVHQSLADYLRDGSEETQPDNT